MQPQLLGKIGPGRYIAPSSGGGGGNTGGGGGVSDGGFDQEPVAVVNSNGDATIKGKAKAGSFGKFVLPLASIAAGTSYTFRYTPNFVALAKQGKLAMVGFGLKFNNDFHLVGLKGDGSTGLKKYKVYGTPPNGWNKDTGHTTSDGGAPANGVQAGPNWIRIIISGDGASYTFQTSKTGVTWTTEFYGSLPSPFSVLSSATVATFGVALWFDNTDAGVFSILIEQYASVSTAPSGFYASAYKNGGNQGTQGVITLDAEISDAQGIHDNSSNPSRFTIPSQWDGRYGRMQANIVGPVNATGQFTGKKSGSSYVGRVANDTSDTSGNEAANMISGVTLLTAGEYYELDSVFTGTVNADLATWVQMELTHRNGALVTKTGTTVVSSGSSQIVPFDSEVYDTGGFHDNSTNNSRMTIPANVSLVRLMGNLECSADGTNLQLIFLKNNTGNWYGNPLDDDDGTGRLSVVSAPIAVVPGDYLEMWMANTGGVTIAANTSFCLQVLPYNLKYALARRSANQAMGAGVATLINWDTEVADTDGWHSIASTVTITIASPGVVTWTGHNFLAGSPIVFSTTGALPTGLSAGTIYYVVNPATNTFQVSTTPGGSAVNTSGSQSGVHTATNSSRFVVPSGVSRVRVTFGMRTEATHTGDISARTLKNGTTFPGMALVRSVSASDDSVCGMTAIIEVTAGDYFELEGTCAASANIGTNFSSWMSIEEVRDGSILDAVRGYQQSIVVDAAYTGQVVRGYQQSIVVDASYSGQVVRGYQQAILVDIPYP